MHDATRREHSVFQRNAGTQKRPALSWRHTEDSWRVVSTFLDSKWDNAEHPSDAEDFHRDEDAGGDGIWRPDDPGQWDTFQRDQYVSQQTFDDRAHQRFRLALQNNPADKYTEGPHPPRDGPDLTDANEVAAFLTEPFTAVLPKDSNDGFQGAGRYSDCDRCNGTGVVCQHDACRSYCTNSTCLEKSDLSKHATLMRGHEQCSCSGPCTKQGGDHESTCPDCNGAGETYSASFTRTFQPVLQADSDTISALITNDTISGFRDDTGISLTDLDLSPIDADADITVDGDTIHVADQEVSLHRINRASDIPDLVSRALALPDDDVLEIVQTGINADMNVRDADAPRDGVVRKMFDKIARDQYSDLVDYVLEVLKPTLETEVVADAADDEPEPQPDPTAVKEVRQQLEATL